MPLVSVVIPAYNRADLLPATISSVLLQTLTDLEVVVVDDGSTDSTRDVIETFAKADSRVRYLFQQNQGRSVARNNGANIATGKYIGVLDSDDEYLPDALLNHLEVFESQPDLGMTVGGYYEVDENGHLLSERTPWLEGGDLTLAGWLFNCYAIPGAVLARRDWFLKSGGYDPDIRIGDDWDHFLQMALAGCPMGWVKKAVCRYRQHGGNTVRSGSIAAVQTNKLGNRQALQKVFSSHLVSQDDAQLQPRALAWVSVQMAKMFLLAGSRELAVNEFVEAYSICPAVFHDRAIEVLQYMLMPSPFAWGSGEIVVADLPNVLPTSLELTAQDVKLASARSEMAGFFRAREAGDYRRARIYLKAGLSQDPTWLANRGVLSFCIRWALNRL